MFNIFESAIWALGCYKHTVLSPVFSVSSYILVLRYTVYLRLSSKIAFRDDKKFAKIEVPTPLEIHIFFSSSKVHFNKLFGVKKGSFSR